MQEIHIKIRDLRKAKGLSQSEIADKLNLTQEGYAKIERGQTQLTVIRAKEIANIFEMSLKELLFDESEVELSKELEALSRELEVLRRENDLLQKGAEDKAQLLALAKASLLELAQPSLSPELYERFKTYTLADLMIALRREC